VQELGANEANGYTETKSRTFTSGFTFYTFHYMYISEITN